MKSQLIIIALRLSESMNSQSSLKQNNGICYGRIISGFQAMESVNP